MPSPPELSFRDLRASFEAKSKQQHHHHHHRQKTAQPTNTDKMSLKPATPSSPLRSPGATQLPSPQRPSWIGPSPTPRPRNEDVAAMKRAITITYTAPNLQPPVYIITSASEPQWEPLEMEYAEERMGSSQLLFTRNFDVDDGEYQYKFRLGPGDWWVCDESNPTVDDGFGNCNNVMLVESAIPNGSAAIEMPLMTQETFPAEEEAAEDARSDASSVSSIESPEDRHEPMTPLFRHETAYEPLAFSSKDEADYDIERRLAAEHAAYSEVVEDRRAVGHVEEGELNEPPAMRHETLNPDVVELERSPLFRHETTTVDSLGRDEDAEPLQLWRTEKPEEEVDIDDPSLERFPTERDGIMAQIQRTATKLLPDLSVPEDTGTGTLPMLSAAVSSGDDTGSSSEKEQMLDSVSEAEEEAESGAGGPAEPEFLVEADKVVPSSDEVVQTTLAAETRPSGPMTPPLTPRDLDKSETAFEKTMQGAPGALQEGSEHEQTPTPIQPETALVNRQENFPIALWRAIYNCFVSLLGGRNAAFVAVAAGVAVVTYVGKAYLMA